MSGQLVTKLVVSGQEGRGSQRERAIAIASGRKSGGGRERRVGRSKETQQV
jgi:hypothetical protein